MSDNNGLSIKERLGGEAVELVRCRTAMLPKAYQNHMRRPTSLNRLLGNNELSFGDVHVEGILSTKSSQSVRKWTRKACSTVLPVVCKGRD